MINFSKNSRADIFIERSKIRYRHFIYVLSVLVNMFCVCRNIGWMSNYSILILIGEFLYKCCKINSCNVSTIVIIVANYWLGTINGYFTVFSILALALIICSLISMQQSSSHSRYISVFGQWFKIYYFIQLAIFLVLVNVVHKLLLWEVMIVATGHLLCVRLYWQIGNSNSLNLQYLEGDAMSQDYCIKCQRSIPYRGYHCSICNRCSTIAQYHNAWLNACINDCNRRTYIVLCLLAAITNIYQIHVSITSVCTPKMFIDWFLIVDDCRYVYSDVIYSWIFVSCAFNMVFTSLVLVTLLYEIVLVSQNITHMEFENCLTFPSCLNKGIVGNWLEFLLWKKE